MVTRNDPAALTEGHIAIYARDGRWRRAVANSLGQAGHSHQEASSAAELHRLLGSQSFNVLTLKLRDEREACEIAEALNDVALPQHTILLGSASALPLTLRRQPMGTFRYVPGQVPARELSRLVEASICAGTWEEGITENGRNAQFEPVDLEETIERAAAAVYDKANRKRQRFATAVEGPTPYVFGNRARLRRTLAALLRLIVSLAPHGALIRVEARTQGEEWVIRVGATKNRSVAYRPAQVAEELRDETKTLTVISRDVREQGGMLWVDLAAPAGLALSLTLPLTPEAVRSASA